MNNAPLRIAILGLGDRGLNAYAPCALRFPEKMKIAAVADPVEEKRLEAAKKYGVPQAMCFRTAEELLAQERLADVAFICTQDRQHCGHAVAALEKGYHLLLEKPIAPTLEECARVQRVAQAAHRHVQVGHVLRYTPFYQTVRQIIQSGRLGEVVSIQAIENVGYWHQAHSFVRGNWANSGRSSPMILQKCCHDMDIMLWLAGKKARYVSSYGSLSHFRPEMAPEGAAKRCLDGCRAKDSCPYDAEKIYLTDRLLKGETGWPVNILNIHPTPENITQALREGPYGLCVYHAGNNVVDHQVVNAELEEGVTLNFTMCAFTSQGGRPLRVMGTRGDLEGDLRTNLIRVGVFGQEPEIIDVAKLAEDFSGHAGGDFRLVEELLDDILAGREPGSGLTSIERSMESHYLALAAEASRLDHGRSIELEQWVAQNGN